MMDRLTEPNYTYNDCDFMESGMAPYMNRLAAYEDTGLTPEEIDASIMVFCLTALGDKCGFGREQLVEFIEAVASIADGVSKGYVNYDDLHRALVEEQDLEW